MDQWLRFLLFWNDNITYFVQWFPVLHSDWNLHSGRERQLSLRMYSCHHGMVVGEWGCRHLWLQLMTWNYYSHCTSGRWWWWDWKSLLHGQSSWGSSSDPPLEYQQEWSPQRQGELWGSGKIFMYNVFVRVVLMLILQEQKKYIKNVTRCRDSRSAKSIEAKWGW